MAEMEMPPPVVGKGRCSYGYLRIVSWWMTVFVEEFRGDAYLVVPIHGIAVEGIIEEIIGILKSCQYSCVEDGGEVERTNFSVAEGQPKDIPRYRSGVCDTEELLVHYSSGGILSRVCICFDFSANLAVGSAGSPWFQNFGSQEVFEREDGRIIREGEELSVEDDPPLALFRSQVLNIWKQRQRESDGSSIGEEDLHFVTFDEGEVRYGRFCWKLAHGFRISFFFPQGISPSGALFQRDVVRQR